MKSINQLLFMLLFMCAAWLSCDNDHLSLDLSEDVMISAFSVHGVQGKIDNEQMTIHVVLPSSSDVTSLIPQITIAEGAKIAPLEGMPINFTNPVKYTVENGGRYNTYTVSVYVIDAQINRFILDNKYQGIINQESKKIIVSVPPTTDVTWMTPAITFTEGAGILPGSNVPQDFSNPVTYTLTYMDETFEYTVEVRKRDEAFAFVGVAATMDGLQSLHEKIPAEWMTQTIPNTSYISFEDVRSGAVELNSFDVVWFHYESSQHLPALVLDASVINKFKEYYQGGGNMVLTSYACLYVGHIGASKNGAPNNVFGDINAWTVPERWGISYKDDETHPLFQGLEQADDLGHPAAYFIDNDVHRRNAGCMWHIEPDPYNQDKAKWAELTGGIPLAALNWDLARTVHVVVAEFPRKKSANGGVICIGAPSYEWYNEDINGTPSPVNPYLNNMKTITQNAIEYIKQ